MRVVVDLREKTGREGPYLFAAIPYLGLVCFVFEVGERDGVRRAELVFKPYERGEAANGNGDDYGAAWRKPRGRRGPQGAGGEGGGGATEPSEGDTPKVRPPRP